MAKGNLNKNEKTAPKLPQHEKLLPYGSLSTKIKIPRFGPRFIIFPKTVSCEVNLALQCSHLLSKFWFEMRDFNFQFSLMMIPMGISFHAVVVLVLGFFQFYSDCPWTYCGYSTLHSVSQDWKFQLSLATLLYDRKITRHCHHIPLPLDFSNCFFIYKKLCYFACAHYNFPTFVGIWNLKVWFFFAFLLCCSIYRNRGKNCQKPFSEKFGSEVCLVLQDEKRASFKNRYFK